MDSVESLVTISIISFTATLAAVLYDLLNEEMDHTTFVWGICPPHIMFTLAALSMWRRKQLNA